MAHPTSRSRVSWRSPPRACEPPVEWTADYSKGTLALDRDDLAIFTARSGRTVKVIPRPRRYQLAAVRLVISAIGRLGPCPRAIPVSC